MKREIDNVLCRSWNMWCKSEAEVESGVLRLLQCGAYNIITKQRALVDSDCDLGDFDYDDDDGRVIRGGKPWNNLGTPDDLCVCEWSTYSQT